MRRLDDGCHITVRVENAAFDIGHEQAALTASRPYIGAVATFTGFVRSDGEGFEGLTLEHYPGMTEKALAHIAESASAKWPLAAICIIHRVGALRVGEPIVLVMAGSAHRAAAFEAAEYMMDYLKTDAPFWKKETRQGADSWVSVRSSDEAARDRW